jgi:hypothetical protein
MAKYGPGAPTRFYGVFLAYRAKSATQALAWFSTPEAAYAATIPGMVVLPAVQQWGQMFLEGRLN